MTDGITVEVHEDASRQEVIVMARVRLDALQAAFEAAESGKALLHSLHERLQDRMIEYLEPRLIAAADVAATPENVQKLLQHAIDHAAATVLQQILASILKKAT